jgi:HAD superfamily hydrolase (TIGR01509 family)
MHWIHNYQLFLFDFDGLLVNTEELHFQAYKQMCANRGFILNWDFPRYCTAAHYSHEGLRDQIYAEFPDLYALEPNWDVLYAEKKEAIVDLIRHGAVHLMPGGEKLLLLLRDANIKRCVVTHSPKALVNDIRKQNPILNSIPFWITREDYTHPKPDPESYLLAIERYAQPNDRIIGFEDTPRGLKALMGTSAKPVLVSKMQVEELPRGVLQYSGLDQLLYSFS